MISKYLALALVGTALVALPASAQTAMKDRSDTTANTHKEGQWRSSKLIGVNVYNDANEKLGEIDEIIIDKSGKVDQVIIGVGGFLGMGEHDVAISMDKLKWVNEPVRSTNAAASNTTAANHNAGANNTTTTNNNAVTTNNAAATNTNTTTSTAPANRPTVATTDKGAVTGEVNRSNRPMRATNEKWYPDHAVLNASKDDLKKMPQFKYE